MKQLTGINVQECTASQTSTAISKPCNGISSTVALDGAQPTTFLFNLADVSGYETNAQGQLVLHFKDSSTLIIPNFKELAESSYTATLEDGTVIQFADMMDSLGNGDSAAPVVLGFNASDIKSVEDADGRLKILLKNGEVKYVDADAASLQFADGTTVTPGQLEDKFEMASADNNKFNDIEPAAGDEKAAAQVAAKAAAAQQMAQLTPEQLAEVEPAAGPGGAGDGGSANFGSAISRATIGGVVDVGPIGPTSLAFGLPTPQPVLPFVQQGVTFPNPPSVNGVDKETFEDNSVQLTVDGAPSVTDGSEFITVVITGIPSTWTFTDIAGGTYDSTTGEWTIILPPGQTFTGGPTILPPVNSDADLPLVVTVTTTNTSTNLSNSASDNFIVVVDAVADTPNFTINNIVVDEDNVAPLNLTASVTDTDGSENIVSYHVSGLPAGFTLSAGTLNADGSYTLTPAQIAGLTISSPANYSGSINIVASVTIYDTPTDQEITLGNNEKTVDLPLTVTWNPIADAPILSIGQNQVLEDGTVALNTSATLVDRDGSEAMTVKIVGIPTTWTITDLKGGTYDAATQTWTISVAAGQDFSGGPVISPPHDSDIDLPLTLIATTNDSGVSTATSTTPFTVIVDAVADNVNLGTHDVVGVSGSAVALDITTSLKDIDGSEKIDSIKLTGIPSGVTLSAGTLNADGSYTLTQAQLAGLKMTAPGNFFGDFDVTVTVLSSEKVTDSDFDLTNNNASNSSTFNVLFDFSPTPPVIDVNNAGPNASADAQVYEDNSVFVPVVVTGQGTDQETMVVTISNLPAGWLIDATGLTGGTPVINGSTITIQLGANTNLGGGIRFTPPANSDVDSLNILVSATSTEPANGKTASSSQDFVVEVDAVADTPLLAATAANGDEDTAIPLTITSSLKDTDGSETLSLTITGVPAGATLSAGTKNADGSWSLTPAQLTGLTLTPQNNFSGTINLVVTSTATETQLNGVDFDFTNNVASTSVNVTVTVAPRGDDPALTTHTAQVYEDGSVQLSIQAAPTDPSESITVNIGNLQGWTVTDLQGGTYNATTGVWSITLPVGASFNGGPIVAPNHDSDVNRDLPVTVVSTDGTSTAQVTSPLSVIVDAVADNVNLSAAGGTGAYNGQVALSLATSLKDVDGSEKIDSVKITGIPSNVSLSAGTKNADGSWSLTTDQLAGLKAVSNGYVGNFTGTITVLSSEKVTDTDFDLTNNNATNSTNFNVSFTLNPTPPVIDVNNAGPNAAADGQVYEDNSVFVPVTVTGQGTDQETMVVTISNLPAGWTIDYSGLTGGTPVLNNGTITISLGANTNLGGGIRFTPPANSDIDSPAITVSATSTEPANGSTASSSQNFNVDVDAVADGVNLSANGGAGKFNGSVDVAIATSLKDTDGSEKIDSVKITGVPANVTLSAGTHNADGSWSLTTDQLAGLKATSNGYVGSFTATVTVLSSEKVSDTDFDFTNNNASNSANLTVTFTLDVVPPVIDVNNAGPNNAADGQTYEDTSVFVPVTVTGQGTDQETMVVTISNLPAGWTIDYSGLTGGTPVLNNGTITISLGANTNLGGGIRFTPPANSDVDSPTITVSATSTEPANGLTASSSQNFIVEVDAVADVPNLSVSAANGNEDAPVALSIQSSLKDTDGSEVLSLKITGVPADASLSAGTKNADGSWSLTPAQLAGLQLNPASNFSGTIALTVYATATETNLSGVELTTANNVATTLANLNVTINPVADTPNVTINNAQVYEDNSVQLNVSATPTDPSESLTVSIGNLQGWTVTNLNGGTFDATTGVWTISLGAGVAFNGGPVVAPPANSDVDRALSVTVVSHDGASTTQVNGTLNVVVDAVADNVNLSASGGAGKINTAVDVAIATSLKDTDGSEKIDSIKITGIPGNVSLSAGTKNGDGSWSLTSDQLSGLKAISNGYAGAFTATVTVLSSEKVTDTDFDQTNNNASNSTNFNVNFDVNTVPPVIEVNHAGPNAAADGKVYEDGTVFVPITVTGQGTDQETMVVTITGLPAGWGVDLSGLTGGTPVVNGSTVTIQLGANTNLGGGITFTPPHDSDVDSPNINVSAVATEPSTGNNASSNVNFNVDVDAVADHVNLSANGGVGAQNTSVALSIATSLKDVDGSERIDSIKITGVPGNVTLSAGTHNADGSWTLSAAQLVGLTAISNGYTGTFNATVAVASSEIVTDTDFDFTNNNALDTANFSVTFNNIPQGPFVNIDTSKDCVFEDTTTLLPFSTGFTGGNGDEVMTVVVSGLPGAGWSVNTNGVGTYNAAAGTWTITLPAGQHDFVNTSLTVTPPANSDIDYNNIVVTATLVDPDNNNATSTASKPMPLEVDAVADGVDVQTTNVTSYFFDTDVKTSGGSHTVNFAANFNFTYRDADGSEHITKIEATGANAQYVKDLYINSEGQLCGTFVWTGKNPPASFAVTVNITTYDTPHDAECTLDNNAIVQPVTITFQPVQIFTPLALDLDGNGLDLVSVHHGVAFDVNNDGHKEQTAWLSGKDAFLAIDNNHDGLINNTSELFGTDGGTHADGFAKLATYDSNGDGVIDAHDAIYNELKLWTDTNGDGISQSDELYSLLDKGIASISLGSQSTFEDKGADYGVVTSKSSFTTTDGQTHDIYDMSFAYESNSALTDAINTFVNTPAETTVADAAHTVAVSNDNASVATQSDLGHSTVTEMLAQLDDVSKAQG